MNAYLGIDTSNYTTSACLYLPEENRVISERKLLPVRHGERGLRQSDAVFHHTVQLPEMIENAFADFGGKLCAVGASERPRAVSGSYMPCFTVGFGTARALSASMKIPLYGFSHQQGHIAAALYSIDRLDLITKPHVAFHVSGGTTEALLVNGGSGFLTTRVIAKTLDLNAGQLIDRVGVLLGLNFPCGKELEKLALLCDETIKIKTKLKDFDCCLSGGENQAKKLADTGAPKEYIARFTIEYVHSAVCAMTEKILSEYPDLPLVYAGGVMSNSIIRNSMEQRLGALFSKPEFSSDNAAGVAVLTCLKEETDVSI